MSRFIAFEQSCKVLMLCTPSPPETSSICAMQQFLQPAPQRADPWPLSTFSLPDENSEIIKALPLGRDASCLRRSGGFESPAAQIARLQAAESIAGGAGEIHRIGLEPHTARICKI